MKNKTTIIIFIIVIAVILGGVSWWQQNKYNQKMMEERILNKKNHDIQTQAVTSKQPPVKIEAAAGGIIFDVKKAKINDQIGNMTITSIEPFSNSPRNKIISSNNAKISFTGEVSVTGTYMYIDGYISGACFRPAEKDLSLFPDIEGDDRTIWFCFDNETFNSAVESLGNEDREATIKINNYVINVYPSSVRNTAYFIQEINN